MPSSYLADAINWSKALTRLRTRGPGDTDNAMRAVAREYQIDYWMLWRLRYRPSAIRDVGVSLYMTLKDAYAAECGRQLKKLENEIAKCSGAVVAAPLLDEAKALVREGGGGLNAARTVYKNAD